MQSRSLARLTDESDNSWQWKEEQLTILEDCIDSLKEKQKQSISLFYIQGKSYDELSKAMNIEWSKVRSLIQNGKRNLKICVENKHEAAGN
jgi:RNA polymerase sigma-70 factor (ECF subfamily)